MSICFLNHIYKIIVHLLVITCKSSFKKILFTLTRGKYEMELLATVILFVVL